MYPALSSPWPGFNCLVVVEYFKGFSQINHTLPASTEPARHNSAPSPLNGTTQPVNVQEEGQSSTIYIQWLRKKEL